MLVEELYYMIVPNGGIRIILPISEEVWIGIGKGDAGAEATRAMRVVWEMVGGLGLKSSDGEFRFENGYCIFLAKGLSADDMTGIEGFTLKMQNLATLTFRFSPLPAEVQEGLLDEAAYA
jgi:hypothetical protein